MRTVRLTAISFVFAALFAVSAFAQGATTPATPAKVMFINTLAFEDKDGIKRYATTMTALENEFKPLMTELNTGRTRYATLQGEVKGLQDKLSAPANSAVPIKREDLEKQFITKSDELTALETDMKRKAEDGNKRLERRRAEMLGPIMEDIGRAMQEFAKKNGYDVILDAAKLEQSGVLLAFDAKADVTKEFITFYNARPASTAAVTKP